MSNTESPTPAPVPTLNQLEMDAGDLNAALDGLEIVIDAIEADTQPATNALNVILYHVRERARRLERNIGYAALRSRGAA
jgi:hypothetical protein